MDGGMVCMYGGMVCMCVSSCVSAHRKSGRHENSETETQAHIQYAVSTVAHIYCMDLTIGLNHNLNHLNLKL